MQLTAVTSTADGRLSAGMVYHGEVVYQPGSLGIPRRPDWAWEPRFLCYDNTGEWMTFDLGVFVPLGEYMHEGVPKERFRAARA